MNSLPALLVGCILVVGPARLSAIEAIAPNLLALSPEEMALCENGCTLVPNAVLQQVVMQQFTRGFTAGQASCGMRVKH